MAGYGNGGTDAAKWSDAATGTFTHRYYPLYDAEGNLTHVKTSGGMTVERWQHNRANRVPTQLFVTDVADDAGNTGANGGTNEGDYNAFFSGTDGFFIAANVKTDFDQDGDADTADYNRFMDTFFEAPAQGRAAGSVFKMVYLAAGQMYDDTLSGPTDPSTMTLTARARWVPWPLILCSWIIGECMTSRTLADCESCCSRLSDQDNAVVTHCISRCRAKFSGIGEMDKCAADAIEGCRGDPYFDVALSYMQSSCSGSSLCSSWKIVCQDQIGEDRLFPPNGRTECGGCTIRLRPGAPDKCNTLLHELIHAGDMCKNGACLGVSFAYRSPQDGFTKVNYCALACSELRAHWYSCCHESRRPGGRSFSTCWKQFVKQYDVILYECHKDVDRSIKSLFQKCVPGTVVGTDATGAECNSDSPPVVPPFIPGPRIPYLPTEWP
ncbi:MAG: hypothetical protein IBJ18_02030 [Phycisphaerales bacterium]|nr:hypothetical protein [Phycisphaerales bacterium]